MKRRGVGERRVEKTVRTFHSSLRTRGTPSIAARSNRPLKTSVEGMSTRVRRLWSRCRPGVPESGLHLRTFQVPCTQATHVKLVVLSNQCTGNPDFNGDQDNDPRSTTNCNGTVIATQARAAELQILSHRTQVDGANRVD